MARFKNMLTVSLLGLAVAIKGTIGATLTSSNLFTSTEPARSPATSASLSSFSGQTTAIGTISNNVIDARDDDGESTPTEVSSLNKPTRTWKSGYPSTACTWSGTVVPCGAAQLSYRAPQPTVYTAIVTTGHPLAARDATTTAPTSPTASALEVQKQDVTATPTMLEITPARLHGRQGCTTTENGLPIDCGTPTPGVPIPTAPDAYGSYDPIDPKSYADGFCRPKSITFGADYHDIDQSVRITCINLVAQATPFGGWGPGNESWAYNPLLEGGSGKKIFFGFRIISGDPNYRFNPTFDECYMTFMEPILSCGTHENSDLYNGGRVTTTGAVTWEIYPDYVFGPDDPAPPEERNGQTTAATAGISCTYGGTLASSQNLQGAVNLFCPNQGTTPMVSGVPQTLMVPLEAGGPYATLTRMQTCSAQQSGGLLACQSGFAPIIDDCQANEGAGESAGGRNVLSDGCTTYSISVSPQAGRAKTVRQDTDSITCDENAVNATELQSAAGQFCSWYMENVTAGVPASEMIPLADGIHTAFFRTDLQTCVDHQSVGSESCVDALAAIIAKFSKGDGTDSSTGGTNLIDGCVEFEIVPSRPHDIAKRAPNATSTSPTVTCNTTNLLPTSPSAMVNLTNAYCAIWEGRVLPPNSPITQQLDLDGLNGGHGSKPEVAEMTLNNTCADSYSVCSLDCAWAFSNITDVCSEYLGAAVGGVFAGGEDGNAASGGGVVTGGEDGCLVYTLELLEIVFS